MPIAIQCPNPACGTSASVPDVIAGRSVKCKRCGTPFVARPTLDGEIGDTRGSHPTRSAADPFRTFPATFGRYKVLKLLGKGGMGSVFLAEDTQLGRKVALKLPAFAPGESPRRAERFVREARSAAGLSHPNICTVYDAGQIDGRPFLSMAYLDGRTLDDAIDPDAPLPPARAATLARQIAHALAHAHAQGIIHRDLKPANVMLTAAGDPVVMDFGLAKRVTESDAEEAKLTRDGAVMGTPTYMAPEQVRGEAVGPPADVYALGVLLFEMLAGRPPYTGPLGVVMGQILHAPVPAVREFRPNADPVLEGLCHKALAKDPAARFPTMAAFAAALDAYLAAPPAPATTSPSDFAFDDDPREPVRRRPTATAVEDEPVAPATRRKTPARSPNRRGLLLAVGGGLVALLVGVALFLTVRTKHGDVVIELNDPTAKVEVKVDGDRVELTGLDKPLTLTAGEHGLTVSGPDFETVTQSFTVKKGEKQVVKVSLKKVPVATGPKAKDPRGAAPSVDTEPEPATKAPLEDGFTPLFTGTDLTGWSGLAGAWRVEGGAAIGRLPPGRETATFLCTQKAYKDFELRFRVKLLNGAGNSGVQIRSRLADPTEFRVVGPQVEVAADKFGGLYGEGTGGGWMQQIPEAEVTRLFKANEFNDYAVRAVGRRVSIVLNGETIVDREFPGIDDTGIIALQLHGKARVEEATFADVRIKELTPAASPPAPAVGAADGFVPLFNGKDLTGWTRQTPGFGNWTVKDGYLTCSGGPMDHLLTEKADYADFHLRAEVRLNATGNSGVYFRAGKPLRLVGDYEAQITHHPGQREKTGALYGLHSSQIPSVTPDTWMVVEVIAQGDRIRVLIDGKETANYLETRPGRPTKGHIAVQHHDTQTVVEFRKIEIKDLAAAPPKAADGFVPLFNGKDLTGWTAVGPPSWRWAGDRLVGAPGGGAGFLMTEDTYEDFEVELQYRLTAGIGSGLFLRANPAGPLSGAAQLEVQIIDDDFPQFAKLTPIQKTGSVFNVFARKAEPAFKPGDWNTLRARLEKRHIQVWVNGTQTIDSDLDAARDKFPQYPGLVRPSGRLALQQNQRTDVEFRDVKVKQLDGPAAPKKAAAPAGATRLGTSSFKVYQTNLTWKEAKGRCEALGGRLAVVKSDEVNRRLTQLITAANLNEAWIGATDEAEEGKWVWLDGTLLGTGYTNWGPLQPNNKMMVEHFALIWLGGKGQFTDNGVWSDQPDVSTQHQPGFVCEWPG